MRLDTIWGVLGVFLVSLGVILETLGSVLGRLGHVNLTQSRPECHLDSLGCFSERFLTKLFWVLLQLHVFERSSKVVFWEFATVARFQRLLHRICRQTQCFRRDLVGGVFPTSLLSGVSISATRVRGKQAYLIGQLRVQL